MTRHAMQSIYLEQAGWKETEESQKGGIGEATWIDPKGICLTPLTTSEAFKAQQQRDEGEAASRRRSG